MKIIAIEWNAAPRGSALLDREGPSPTRHALSLTASRSHSHMSPALHTDDPSRRPEQPPGALRDDLCGSRTCSLALSTSASRSRGVLSEVQSKGRRGEQA
jgi:hypothetical protein